MKRILAVLTFVLCLALIPSLVFAQGENPPVDPNGAWGEVVNPDGSIRYDNLTDLGEIQEPANWMPEIPGIGGLPATYHRYQTPSGNIIVMPSASTLFFMALNPQASGLGNSDSQLGLGAGMALELPGLIKGMLQGYIDPSAITQMGYSNPDDFFTDVISGKQNIWSILGDNTINFLLALARESITDENFYAMLLLYTQGNCDHVPGGCPEGANLPTPPLPPSCSTPIITKGAITVTARKIAPMNPIVVGQDAERRGADLTWEVRVEPTIYTYGVEVPVYGTVCTERHAGDPAGNCKTSPSMWYNDGIQHTQIVGYNCEQHTLTFPETLNWVSASASLSQESQDWILNTLSIRYPEAYIHNPTFTFPGNPGSGGFQGNTFVWTFGRDRVQLADPGWFNLAVSGATSGTPVSTGRGFSRSGEQVQVFLMETAIIK